MASDSESIRATAIEAADKAYDEWSADELADVRDAWMAGALSVLPAVVAQVQADADEKNAKYFHDGWVAALREIRLRGDRKVGEFLVEQLGEATDE